MSDLNNSEANILRNLLEQLIELKPMGWSIIHGLNELVVRPSDRDVGKFNITIIHTDVSLNFCISFFSPTLNHWDGSKYFDVAQDNSTSILNWAKEKIEFEKSRNVII